MKKIIAECEHCEAKPEVVCVHKNSLCYIYTCPECGSDTVVTTDLGKTLSRVSGEQSEKIKKSLFDTLNVDVKVKIEIIEIDTQESVESFADFYGKKEKQ